MNVLVINCGSSSLKYQLINSDSEEVLAKGLCERIGIDGRLVYQKEGLDKEITEAPMPTHKEAIQMVLDALVNPKTGAVKSLAEIDAVGHRVVHGGEKFSDSVVITEEVIAQVEECNDLAPLHNPANIIGIRACQALMPNVPMVGVFDTAFHQTMPEKAYLYGLPYEYYEKYKVRRYGFHGTSHSFVSKEAASYLGMDLNNSKIIVAHLGNGASVSAVLNGKCVDTTMGLTPLEGVVMGTRFVATTECPISDNHKEWLLEHTEKDTVIIQKSIHNAARVANNMAAKLTLEMEKRGTTLEELMTVIAGRLSKKCYKNGDIDGGIYALGPAMGLIDDIKPVQQLMDDMVAEAEEVIGGLKASIY